MCVEKCNEVFVWHFLAVASYILLDICNNHSGGKIHFLLSAALLNHLRVLR